MKILNFYTIFGITLVLGLLILTSSDLTSGDKKNSNLEIVKTNVDGKGTSLSIEFVSGESHNHPTMVVWIEDMDENFIQTLYITESVATGIYGHGEKEQNKWKHESGAVQRPATLPYFLHKRNLKANDGTFLPSPENPIPDAYSGATPISGFNLETKTDEPLSGKFRLMFEVNQPWDWNKYWHNSLYPDNFDYKTSCQPAVVYSVTIHVDNKGVYYLNPIGHSHYSGADGLLYTDLSTITTAKDIFMSIKVTLK